MASTSIERHDPDIGHRRVEVCASVLEPQPQPHRAVRGEVRGLEQELVGERAVATLAPGQVDAVADLAVELDVVRLAVWAVEGLDHSDDELTVRRHLDVDLEPAAGEGRARVLPRQTRFDVGAGAFLP